MNTVDPAIVIWVGLGGGVLALVTMCIKLLVTEKPGASLWAPGAVAIVLIGMSFWTKVRIEGGGITIELEQRIEELDTKVKVAEVKLQEAAAAEERIVEQLEVVTNRVIRTEAELVEFTRVLEQPQPVQPDRARDLRRTIEAQPELDTRRLDDARMRLRRVQPNGEARPHQ